MSEMDDLWERLDAATAEIERLRSEKDELVQLSRLALDCLDTLAGKVAAAYPVEMQAVARAISLGRKALDS